MNTSTKSKKTDREEPPGSRPAWLVALIANVKGETERPLDSPPDFGAEFDREETLRAILDAIESGGHRSAFIPADTNLPIALQEIHPDICFNIAEGLHGDGREAHVPALLEMYAIPYTASRVVANAISLDKTLTKRLWRDAGLPVVPFQEFNNNDEPIRPGLRFTKPYDGHRLEWRQEFRILCCHRFTEPTEKPGLSDPVREQIVDDMEGDVIRAIWADVRLGHPELIIDSLQEPATTDLDWSVTSWAICEVKLVVRYQHQQDGR